MSHPPSVSEAAAEVNRAKKDLDNAEQLIARLQLETFDAGRAYDMAQMRLEEANRVLLEVASE